MQLAIQCQEDACEIQRFPTFKKIQRGIEKKQKILIQKIFYSASLVDIQNNILVVDILQSIVEAISSNF